MLKLVYDANADPQPKPNPEGQPGEQPLPPLEVPNTDPHTPVSPPEKAGERG